MANRVWRCLSDGKESIVKELVRECGIPRATAMYLASRGITMNSQARYFSSSLADLSDPFRFKDMDLAVTRLWKAIRNRETILIYGDYDTDGITATALLTRALESNGGIVVPFLPHRFDSPVGFSPESLDKALEELPNGDKCGVVVTVDSGINSIDTVEKAKTLGVDVIITDHHDPAEELPKAYAILNPKIEPETLDDLLHLSGVGVAFKLAHAIFLRNGISSPAEIEQYLEEVLDFVALGTVADIVPLQGENRILVREGMKTLNKQLRPGVCALIESAQTTGKLQPLDITFRLAPRLNAACRLHNASPKDALDLMMADNFQEARAMASKLENYNRIRHDWEQRIFTQAKKQVECVQGFEKRVSIVAAGEGWHQGVIGIVASRFARDYNKPAIVFTINGDEAHGSGRSVGSINLIEALSKCSHLLTRFGGHPMAVGVGLETSKINEFREAFEAAVKELAKPDDLLFHVNYDGEIFFEDINDDFFDYYKFLSPFGHGNPIPSFLVRNVGVYKLLRSSTNHMRGQLIDSHGEFYNFFALNKNLTQDMQWDVIVQPQITEYYGESRKQLLVTHFRPSEDA